MANIVRFQPAGWTPGGVTESIEGSSTGDTSDSGTLSEQSDATPLFYDGFESGDDSHTENGYSWVETWGAAESASGDGAEVLEGDWAWRTRYLAGQNRNQNIRIGGPKLQEFWFDYYWRVPDNYCHHDSTTPHNKWAEFFHTRSELYVISELWSTTGECDGRLTWITNGEPHINVADPALLIPEERQVWKRWRYHVKYTTNSSTNVTVEYEGWIDDTKEWSVSRTIDGVDEADHGASEFQIMGWNSVDYEEDHTIYIDEVSLYDQDPGWPSQTF